MAEREKRQDKVLYEEFKLGMDELNLAEYPLAGIADRFLDGRKTVVFKDQVWDPDRRLHIPRELAISGSDRYGLPTASDDDVLLACMQLAHMDGFKSREVSFSRYGLLKLLRWPDEGKYYKRLFLALRRWKGVTIYSNRAFYDHAKKSWINRDFGIFDNLYVYEREEARGGEQHSWFVWNEVVFESIQAGYVKSLDWDLYCRLTNPVAKRLYRLLDKRFYRADRLVLDLHDLAVHKVRLSENYNTAQIKRALLNGIRELEQLWDLRSAEPEERFRKVSTGKWEAVFERKARNAKATATRQSTVAAESSSLCDLLKARGVSAKMAERLSTQHSAERITKTIALFDWHAQRGDKKGPGFLVAGIRSVDGFEPPHELQSQRTVGTVATADKAKRPQQRDNASRRAEERQAVLDREKSQRVAQFLAALTSEQRDELRREAFANANPFFLRQFERNTENAEVSVKYERLIIETHVSVMLSAREKVSTNDSA